MALCHRICSPTTFLSYNFSQSLSLLGKSTLNSVSLSWFLFKNHFWLNCWSLLLARRSQLKILIWWLGVSTVHVMMNPSSILVVIFTPPILGSWHAVLNRTILTSRWSDLELSISWFLRSALFIMRFYCRRSAIPPADKVTLLVFNVLYFPTTSADCIFNGNSNPQLQRVYIYPIIELISHQARNGISVSSKHLPDLAYFSEFKEKTSLGFYNNSNTPVSFSGSNFCWFVSGAMSSSPRSVLDANFQCEAAPIFLEEHPSSALVKALRHTLAGKLLTAKRPSVASLSVAAARLWNCPHRLSCYDHGKCLYSFEFTYAPDVERVIAGGPWYINGDLLLISCMNPNQSIEQLLFAYAKLWVRCYDLPPKCFTKEYATAIGNSLGKYCDTDLPPENPEEAKLLIRKTPTVRKYLRVKFDFNLYGPLKSTQEIKICNSKKEVVEVHISRLTYERLPLTCFRCGFIGHLMDSCPHEGPMLYGEWIRAEKFHRINLSHAIPKPVPPIKEGQCSTSLQVGNQVTRVSNVAELVNTMIEDPNIIKANYSQARAEGPLPISKGKAPMLESGRIPPFNCSIVAISDSSPPKSVSPKTVFGVCGDSIMGPVPTFMRLQSSPNGSDPAFMDSDENNFVSYLNAIASHDDQFAATPNRSLFKNDSNFSAGGVSPKGTAISTIVPTTVHTLDSSAIPDGAPRLISTVFKEEISKLPPRKRAPANSQTPRPKRGRQQSSTSDSQV